MPFAKSKGPSKKRKVNPRTVAVYKAPSDRMVKQMVTMRYSSAFTLDPTLGGITDVHVFSANGMFDPDISGTGHQPRGFDQYMPLFDHYVVTSAVMRADFSWPTTTGTIREPLVVGIGLNDDTGGHLSNSYDYQENAYTKYKLLGPGATGSDTLTVYNSVIPSKFLGRSGALNDPQLKGSVSANPTEQVFFDVFASPLTGNNVDSIFATIQITYTCYLIEPRLPSAS